MTNVYRMTVSGETDVVMRRVELEADGWGGSYTPTSGLGGRLRLPVQAGLRYGWIEGTLAATRDADSEGAATENKPRVALVLEIEKSELVVQKAAAGVLLLAALGAITVVLAPLAPVFFRLMPVGIMLSLAGWLFVVARLRNSGPEEFLAVLGDSDQARE